MSRALMSHFSLSAMPFDKEIASEQLLELTTTKKAMSSLRLLVETRGIGLLTGKSGSGKSCLLRKLLNEMNGNLYKPLYLCHTSVGLTEFYTHLCVALGLEPVGRKATMFRLIKERLLQLHRQSKIHPVLIIDEAHLLSTEILSDIRLLTNFEIDSINALTVLLCGQESLNQKFGLTILESLANSISISVHSECLPKDETFALIEARLSACGGNTGIFTKNALTLIHQSSMGIFRSIGTIATASMNMAMTANSPIVETEHVQNVLKR